MHLVNQPVLGRYTCHDLLRHYAADRAAVEDDDADREAALRRLLDWYLHRADRAARVLYPHPHAPAGAGRRSAVVNRPPTGRPRPHVTDEAAALAWLDAERANLIAAIRHAAEHGPRSRAWLLADTLRAYFWLRMHTVDWQDAARTALAAAEAEGDLRAQAAALLSLGDFHFRQGRVRAGHRAVRSPRSPSPSGPGGSECEAAAIGNLGVMYRDSGRLRQAVDILAEG